jgi:transposase
MGVTTYSTFEVRDRAVRAVLDGMSVVAVAQAYGTDRSTVHRWVARFEAQGARGLRRKSGSGRPRKMGTLTDDDLLDIVLSPASEFGFETDLWTAGRVHDVLTVQYGFLVSNNTVWRRLRDAGLTYQKPDRVYFQMDEEERRRWLRTTLPTIRRAVKEYKAILYFEDESNIALSPYLGKTWWLRGETPQAQATGTRGSVSAMSAISPTGRLLFKLYRKRIASGEIIEFLAQMLSHHKRRHLVVVMDQAPPHTSQKTNSFIGSQRRLHVFHLPKYSPDWNPDEKVWSHLKTHALKSHKAKTKEELELLTNHKLTTMSHDSELIQGLYFRCCVADFLG